MRTILSGRIQPAMLFLEPAQGNGQGEGGSGTGQQPQGQPPAQQGQQSQQQQQQAPPDPFAGIDLDMQPDHIRQAIEASRNSLQQLQTQAQQGAVAQQTVQQMQQEVERMRQQILQQQPAGPPTPRGNGEPQTFEAQLEQYYLTQGFTAEQAKKVAVANKGAFEIFGQHFQRQIGSQFAPIASRVVEDSAQQAFESALSNDRVGWSGNEEIKQALWDRTQQLAADGQIVNAAVVSNLAKIFYYDHLERNGGQPSVSPNIIPINQPHSIPNMTPGFIPNQQVSRFSYPGAGNVQMPRHTSNTGASPLDPETAAAMAATTANWSPQLQDALKRKQAGGR